MFSLFDDEFVMHDWLWELSRNGFAHEVQARVDRRTAVRPLLISHTAK